MHTSANSPHSAGWSCKSGSPLPDSLEIPSERAQQLWSPPKHEARKSNRQPTERWHHNWTGSLEQALPKPMLIRHISSHIRHFKLDLYLKNIFSRQEKAIIWLAHGVRLLQYVFNPERHVLGHNVRFLEQVPLSEFWNLGLEGEFRRIEQEVINTTLGDSIGHSECFHIPVKNC